MSVHYITDEKGETTGVFIPIHEWDNVESRYVGTDEDECEVQEWQKEIVRQRIYQTAPDEYLSWEEIRRQIKID